MVRIISQENATWQGQVTWLDNDQTENFRSMLELIRLMAAAIEREEEGRMKQKDAAALRIETEKHRK